MDVAARVGSVVAGVYRIDALLGSGGYGAVFRATRTDQGREVALKVLRRDTEGAIAPEARARFEREARLAQQLEHPNTVRVLDFGSDESGTSYIAFELVRGRPLDELGAEGPMAPGRVAHIAAQVLKSLMEAHGLGIVHRDIKPANILVCPVAGDADHVKVVDFGIAKMSGPDRGTTLTAAGETVGTPAYMAPEQVLARDVGPPVDLYALGLVMAELLTGERVFRGESSMAICMAQVDAAPVPLPPAVLESSLGSVVARATRKRAGDRYASAEKMLADLAAISSVRSAVISVPSGGGARIDAFADTMMGESVQPFPAAPTQAAAAMPGPSRSQAPLAPTAPRPPPRRTGWVVAIAGLFACLAIAAIALAWFLRDGRRPLRRPAPPPPPSSAPAPDRPLGRLTRETTRARLLALGWTVGMERPIDEGPLRITQFVATRAPLPDAVTVAIHEHAAPAGAQAAEQSLRDRFPRKLIAREGTRVLVVSCDRMNDAVRELFEGLQR